MERKQRRMHEQQRGGLTPKERAWEEECRAQVRCLSLPALKSAVEEKNWVAAPLTIKSVTETIQRRENYFPKLRQHRAETGSSEVHKAFKNYIEQLAILQRLLELMQIEEASMSRTKSKLWLAESLAAVEKRPESMELGREQGPVETKLRKVSGDQFFSGRKSEGEIGDGNNKQNGPVKRKGTPGKKGACQRRSKTCLKFSVATGGIFAGRDKETENNKQSGNGKCIVELLCRVCSGSIDTKRLHRVCIGKQSLRVCAACLKKANSTTDEATRLSDAELDSNDPVTVILKVQEADKIGFLEIFKSSITPSARKKQKNTAEDTSQNQAMGTEADPIMLGSEDEQEAPKLGSVPTVVVNPNQRQTRRNSVLQTDPILDQLKSLMPPQGGTGAVRFTVRDYLRLAPEEFMNDSCIDYYLRYMQYRLEKEKPEDANRCYFFNSFFYKKLSDKRVSDISEETKALVDSLDSLTASEQQALRCYDVIKKWTKNVDIFSKDFIFIPIHDHLHWSLMIICHPGATIKLPLPEGKSYSVSKEPEAFIIHLDSMKSGGHTSLPIIKLIKHYLQNEWNAKLKDSSASSNIAKMWSEGHPGEVRSFKMMKFKRPNLPKQENHFDCGCFVCAFVEHFLAHLPTTLNCQMLESLRNDRLRAMIQGNRSVMITSDPRYLKFDWFKSCNASLIRHYMSKMALVDMAKDAGLMDEHGRWQLDDIPHNRSHQAQFIMTQIEKLEQMPSYDPPSWNEDLEIVQEDGDPKGHESDIEICGSPSARACEIDDPIVNTDDENEKGKDVDLVSKTRFEMLTQTQGSQDGIENEEPSASIKDNFFIDFSRRSNKNEDEDDTVIDAGDEDIKIDIECTARKSKNPFARKVPVVPSPVNSIAADKKPALASFSRKKQGRGRSLVRSVHKGKTVSKGATTAHARDLQTITDCLSIARESRKNAQDGKVNDLT
eukprot:jgi/Picsp_1/309/NSC_00308-R1_protein